MDLSELSKGDLIRINQDLVQKIDYLKFELAQLKRAISGSKSERFVPSEIAGQGDLFNKEVVLVGEASEIEKKITTARKARKQPKRKKIPAHLPRVETIIEPQVDVNVMKRLGEQVSEKLEIKPAQIFVRKTTRPKYIDADKKIHIAPLNDPFPKCMAGTSLVAHVAVQKFVDHLPLYRQSKIFKRDQIDLPRSTLCSMLSRTAQLLTPLYRVLSDHVMQTGYVQADESSIPVLTKDKPGSALKGQMLAKVAPVEKLVVFDYIKTKEKLSILDSLAGFKGYLQVDGNVTYEDKGKEADVELMHCLAHSRRYFEKALEYDRKRSGYVLEKIKHLYIIEREANAENLQGEDLVKKRTKESIPILNSLKIWLEKNRDTGHPRNPFKTAVTYMLKRWPGLIKYTSKGELLPDNNLIENQIRPLALGRKNYMFVVSHKGAKNAALFYSFFATCYQHGLDPKDWLTDVLNRISDHHVNKLSELLPIADYEFSTMSDKAITSLAV